MIMKETLDIDGQLCKSICPAMCGPEDMPCPGGVDRGGCPMPDICMPKERCLDTEGEPCPVSCPINCGPGEMICLGGLDDVGCATGAMCVPEEGKCLVRGYCILCYPNI